MEKRRGFPPVYKIERVEKMSVKCAFFSVFQKIMVICGVMMVPLFGGVAHSTGVVFKRFTILCSVLLMIFAAPAHADTMCNLYNKADGVLYGYPTADITWYARTNGENSELTIRMRLTEGKTYTAIRAVAGGTPAFRIQASPTETLTNGQSLVNINSAGNTNTKTFVVPTGAPYVLFYVRNTYGSSNAVTKDEVINGFMLVEGSTAPTEYIPYNTNCGVVPVQRDAQCSKHGMKYVSRSLIPNISDDYASYYYTEAGRVMSYSNGVLSVTWPTSDTTSGNNNGITARNMDFIGGHVYASIGYVNSDGTFNLGVGGANGLITGAVGSIPATNGWQWACNRLVVTNNVNAHPNFRIMQKGKTLSISEIYLVDLTEMFGAGNEPATSEAIIAALVDNNCAAKIKIATTAYNAARFNPVKTDLNNAVAIIREIVTKTINQTAAIASLQADKQTRPEDACPAGKKCLLVETEENGVIVPHWFPIIEAPE